MRKIIAAMNMTLDGYCDHTVMNADDEIHQHYTDLLNSGDIVIYGMITYHLMESYWPIIVKEPTGNQTTDDFAIAIDTISKLVFSRTLKEDNLKWKNTRIATGTLEEEIRALKQQPGGDVFVGSPGLIAACTNLGLIDEYQLSVHPVIAGKGLTLFKNISERVDLDLIKTKTFECGAVTFYYWHEKKQGSPGST